MDDSILDRLLFLTHRIPYPPNKGDKIRSYHMLKCLAHRYEVYLGTFVDDERDWQYTSLVDSLCAGTYYARLNPVRARLRSLRALVTGKAFTLAYYYDKGLFRWVEGLLGAEDIQRVLVFSSAMAQYVIWTDRDRIRKVIDFVDIDSDKWAQYSETMPWPKSWIYAHEARGLARYEEQVARAYDNSIVVSEAEAALFKTRLPDIAHRIGWVDNGVDAEYFSPMKSYQNPYPPARRVIIFTGAMDYWPNVDAVIWFAREVFPMVREVHGDAWFYIVGSRPTTAVEKLAGLPQIKVTGTVEDVRPYLAHALVAVAPLRLSRGIQNKVLEAMAMGKPVVATSRALDGLINGANAIRADTATELSIGVAACLDEGRIGGARATSSRDYVMDNYEWATNMEQLVKVLEGETVSRCIA